MEIKQAISFWPETERPRERLLALGPSALSDAELIAILLGNGSKGNSAIDLARDLLQRHGGLSALGRLSPAKMTALTGLGSAKAARILAACELGRRREGKNAPRGQNLSTPEDAARLAAAQLRDCQQECFLALYMDIKNRLLRAEIISIGSCDQAPVHPGEVLRRAVELSCSAIIVAHNHPSGDAAPSPADIQLTEQLYQAAKLLGIRLVDHVIIGDGEYKSLMAEGYLPDSGGGRIRAR